MLEGVAQGVSALWRCQPSNPPRGFNPTLPPATSLSCRIIPSPLSIVYSPIVSLFENFLIFSPPRNNCPLIFRASRCCFMKQVLWMVCFCATRKGQLKAGCLCLWPRALRSQFGRLLLFCPGIVEICAIIYGLVCVMSKWTCCFKINQIRKRGSNWMVRVAIVPIQGG